MAEVLRVHGDFIAFATDADGSEFEESESAAIDNSANRWPVGGNGSTWLGRERRSDFLASEYFRFLPSIVAIVSDTRYRITLGDLGALRSTSAQSRVVALKKLHFGMGYEKRRGCRCCRSRKSFAA
jgi:hypothetical protein